jgi:hypothetical protein
MKIIAFTIGILTFASGLWATDWKIGSSLKGATDGLTSADLFSREKLGFWPEDEISLYSLADGSKLIISANYFPIGVVTKVNGKNVFLLDYNGDSILDYSPEYLFVPPWVVDNTSKGTDHGEKILELYEKKFDSYNGNELPSDSQEMKDVGKNLVGAAKDSNAPDRIYIYFDYLYELSYSRKDFEIAEIDLLNIEKITSTTTKSRSAWLIEAIERSYKVNDLGKTKKYDDELVKISPEFVPGLYYQYVLETDMSSKQQMKTSLLKRYKDHWMIRDRFSGENAN